MITNVERFCLFMQEYKPFFLPPEAKQEEILFFDIETTGLSHRTSRVCLIGAACQDKNGWNFFQYLAESESDEEELSVLTAFFSLCSQKKYLLHYNGTTFDIPYLTHRCREHKLLSPLEGMISLDLYRIFAPFRPYIKIPDFRQRSLEQMAGFHRCDKLSGKEWVSLYKHYAKTKEEDTLRLLLTHNQDDVAGMAHLLRLGGLLALGQGNFTADTPQTVTERDMEGNLLERALFTLHIPVSLPAPLSLSLPSCYVTFEQNTVRVKIPLLEGTLKFYYPNFKEYYYLPLEDEAVHKSVGKYVDSACREQAKACNCHKPVSGRFLAAFGTPPLPLFRENYKDENRYIQWTESFFMDSNLVKLYLAEYFQCFL